MDSQLGTYIYLHIYLHQSILNYIWLQRIPLDYVRFDYILECIRLHKTTLDYITSITFALDCMAWKLTWRYIMYIMWTIVYIGTYVDST